MAIRSGPIERGPETIPNAETPLHGSKTINLRFMNSAIGSGEIFVELNSGENVDIEARASLAEEVLAFTTTLEPEIMDFVTLILGIRAFEKLGKTMAETVDMIAAVGIHGESALGEVRRPEWRKKVLSSMKEKAEISRQNLRDKGVRVIDLKVVPGFSENLMVSPDLFL